MSQCLQKWQTDLRVTLSALELAGSLAKLQIENTGETRYVELLTHNTYMLGLSDTTVLAIYRDILKVSISQYFVINYHDTMPVHYRH